MDSSSVLSLLTRDEAKERPSAGATCGDQAWTSAAAAWAARKTRAPPGPRVSYDLRGGRGAVKTRSSLASDKKRVRLLPLLQLLQLPRDRLGLGQRRPPPPPGKAGLRWASQGLVGVESRAPAPEATLARLPRCPRARGPAARASAHQGAGIRQAACRIRWSSLHIALLAGGKPT